MKRLIVALAIASMTMAGIGATKEENTALSDIPVAEITSTNVNAYVDACIALEKSGGWNLLELQKRGLLTFEQVAEKLAGKPWAVLAFARNAKNSSNETVIVQTIDSLTSMAVSYKDDYTVKNALVTAIVENNASDDKRIEVAQSLVDGGVPMLAIRILLIEKINTKSEAYLDRIDGMAMNLFQVWLNTEPTGEKFWQRFFIDGGDIVYYVRRKGKDRSLFEQTKSKMEKYHRAGVDYFAQPRTEYGIFQTKAYLQSPAPAEKKLPLAKKIDKLNGNKAEVTALYPALTDEKTKIETAIWLNDNDKLIDALKVASDKLDAATVESVIAPLNGINAGYRTADLKLALLNINKKYTLKLYDDRDTWEPILSKVRAMIDTL